jgi:hypothetical protein
LRKLDPTVADKASVSLPVPSPRSACGATTPN